MAIVVALVGGVRSTWSPCGVSMLSTITPMAEKGRGHRWWATATWYLAGSVAGGATLGAVLALLAAGVHALAPAVTTTAATVVAAAITLVAAAAEAGVVALPIHHRQVNERWLDAYRPWVYATGFGWQIGTGVATYIKTSAVYVLIALAALTGNPARRPGRRRPLRAGPRRGRLRQPGHHQPSALASFHRRFMELDRPARATVVVVELAAAAVLSWVVSPWLAVALPSRLVAVALPSGPSTPPPPPTSAPTPAPVPIEPAGPATSPGGSRTARTA